MGVAVGAEYLSVPVARLDRPFVDEILNASQEAVDCMQPMGQTSENVAKDFNITREAQDVYAVESYRRAEMAQSAGWFDDEIVPINVTLDGKEVTLIKDDCLRPVCALALLNISSDFKAWFHNSTPPKLKTGLPSAFLSADSSTILLLGHDIRKDQQAATIIP